jgi:hypothetical protein
MTGFGDILNLFFSLLLQSVRGQDQLGQGLEDALPKRGLYDDLENTNIEEHVCLSRTFAARYNYRKEAPTTIRAHSTSDKPTITWSMPIFSLARMC